MRDRSRRRFVDGCRKARRLARIGQGKSRRYLRCGFCERTAAAADPGADPAGTGSEVTQISIVTTRSGEKKGVVSPLLLPDYALLDADLTLGCPPHVTAATGVDAMVHAIEAYTSKHAGKSDFGRAGSRCPAASERQYPHCLHQGQRQERTPEHAARRNAGRHGVRECAGRRRSCAGLSHRRALPRGARLVKRPGAAACPALQRAGCGVALCRAERDSAPHAKGSEDARSMAMVDVLSALTAELGLETRLNQVGISQKDLTGLAEDAMKQTRLLVNIPAKSPTTCAGHYQEAL